MAEVLSLLQHLKPTVGSAVDALVAVINATFVQFGFRVVGLESGPIPDTPDTPAFPAGWNNSPHVYVFHYKHGRSSMNFTVKCVVMEDKLLVHAVAKETGRVFSTEFTISDHVRTAEYGDLDRAYPKIEDTVGQVRMDLCQRLVPDTQKPGYQETRPDDVRSTARASPPSAAAPPAAAQPAPMRPRRDDPLIDPTFVPPPRRPMVPGYPGGLPGMGGFGEDDLYGGLPAMPGQSMGPRGGGMIMGPGHPAFGLPPPGFDEQRLRLPRGAVPPGARYDPVGPPGMNPRAPGFPPVPAPGRRGYGDAEPPGRGDDEDDENPYWG